LFGYDSVCAMPITLHLDAANPAHIIRAAELLRQGKLVAFATETVYGLGANALSEEAVEGIFVAKKRPHWDPLIVHLASMAQLSAVALLDAGTARRVLVLAQAFWPGPLTLLLPRTSAVPDAVTAGRDLVGIRIPAHPAARALLAEACVPVAAPSANLFGHTSPTTAAHVLADLDGRIDAVLDAGPTTIGVESTVLDPASTPMVLYRPGAITAEQITAATGVAVHTFVLPASSEEPESLPSPGVGIRHYAPRARLVLVEGNVQALDAALLETSQVGVGVLLPLEWELDGEAIVEPWGRWDDLDSLAASLFSGLRALDDRGAKLILCPLPPAGGLADAIRDRLQKAARTE
jgi:L-threonylcarbamoyladenylate synthase